MGNVRRGAAAAVCLGVCAIAIGVACTSGGGEPAARVEGPVAVAARTETAQEEAPAWIEAEAPPEPGRADAIPVERAAELPAAPPVREQAATAGILELAEGAPTSPSVRGAAPADVDALGALMGDGVGGNFGFGGLGARGTGRGGAAAAPMRGEGAGAPSTSSPPRSPAGAPGAAAPRLRSSAPPPAAAFAAAPLPTSGVLASTFVGGRGAQARLEDLLDRGVMVGGEHLRLEAFDELERLPYPVPGDDAVALYAGLERTRLRTEGERVHLQIALLARQGELPARPRMDVRLVLDRSGSMDGDKWTHAIAAAHALVDRLQAGDTFGLVSYSDDATIDLAPQRVGDRRAAHAAIDRLVIGGGTNIDAALALAQSDAPVRRGPRDVALVVLLSDGVANVGQTMPEMIAARARQMFDASGVLTTAIGVGTDFDEATMLAVAREGSGSYHFVRRSEDIAGILSDELEQRAQSVAQDVRLRIELAPGVVARRVYGSRILAEQEAAAVRATEVATDARLARELGIARDRQEDDQRGLRMHFPTFRRGDQHVVLMELDVPPGTDAAQIARVSLDWKDLRREENDHARLEVRAERTADADLAIASTDRLVKRTVLAFSAGDALQQCARALETGDVGGAEVALSERIELLRAASSLWRDPALDRDARLLEQYRRVVAGAWGGFDDPSRRTLLMAMNDYGDRRMR